MLIERIYPILIALILTPIAMYYDINYICDKNINDALNGILTITTLIIGLWGTVFPLVLNAKNDSDVVRTVFDKDKKGLYSEYMKAMLVSGVILIMVTLSVYFRDSYKYTFYYNHVFYLLVFFFILFISTTFRCIHITINLVFLDKKLSNDYKSPEKTALTQEFDEKLKKNTME